MLQKRFFVPTSAVVLSAMVFLPGCQSYAVSQPAASTETASPVPSVNPSVNPSLKPTVKDVNVKPSLEDTVTVSGGKAVVTNANALSVVVNKKRALPDNYAPNDLVEPNVPFPFKEKLEKRMMRSEAAKALEKLFTLAEKDNIKLYGVSGYRSYTTQKAIFSGNVKTMGEEEARKISAVPGQSEHQTGLAIDVSSASAKFALEESFGTTLEGKWLAGHAHEAGFIIRYPKGKETITGYSYEPWHIRYVGEAMAKEIHNKGITLEEYFQDAVPASQKR